MKEMDKLTQDEILKKFPWAEELDIEKEMRTEEGYFYKIPEWQFSDIMMQMIHDMLQEMSDFYKSLNKYPEVTIYEIKDLLGYLKVDLLTGYEEIYAIRNKYEKLSEITCSDCGNIGERRRLKKEYIVFCDICYYKRVF